jgi:hypothetical protein
VSITTQELRSLITPEGELRLTLEEVDIPAPGPGEVVIRVDAAPLNPSDVGELLGPADVTTLNTSGPAGRPVTTAKIPPHSHRAPQAGWASRWLSAMRVPASCSPPANTRSTWSARLLAQSLSGCAPGIAS